jgi:hypothetical protein
MISICTLKLELTSDKKERLFPPRPQRSEATKQNTSAVQDKISYVKIKKAESERYAFELWKRQNAGKYESNSSAPLPREIEEIFKKLS